MKTKITDAMLEEMKNKFFDGYVMRLGKFAFCLDNITAEQYEYIYEAITKNIPTERTLKNDR